MNVNKSQYCYPKNYQYERKLSNFVFVKILLDKFVKYLQLTEGEQARGAYTLTYDSVRLSLELLCPVPD